jgi:hypothetical protein
LLLPPRVLLQCKKAERHISGMMLMDAGTWALVQQQQQMHHSRVPSPWRMAMSATGMPRGGNGTTTKSKDGGSESRPKEKVEVD